jgi:hypothetical protein
VSDAPESAGRADAIAAHVERYIGPIRQVLSDTHADHPVDVLRIEPTEERRYHTLITSGMSDRAMSVPSGSKAPRYLELMCTLPKTWDLAASGGTEGDWPLRELRRLARLPQETNAWLAWGHTVPNGDPPRPFARDTKLCGVIIVPSLMVPRLFYELAIDDRTVTFYSIVPLYKEELSLKEEIGMEKLLERLIDRDVDDVIQPRRRNVARKLFGLL